jgi:hypothetical protein
MDIIQLKCGRTANNKLLVQLKSQLKKKSAAGVQTSANVALQSAFKIAGIAGQKN